MMVITTSISTSVKPPRESRKRKAESRGGECLLRAAARRAQRVMFVLGFVGAAMILLRVVRSFRFPLSAFRFLTSDSE
jgi:hypothetical protein